jgi:hypothetical protein
VNVPYGRMILRPLAPDHRCNSFVVS